jgi:mitochondrial fission protein ELM1
VLIGRPWSRLAAFDLVVSTPQYRVAGRNVQHNFLPLVAPLAARLASARTDWQATFADLPTPRIGVLLGGDSGWYRFRGADGAALGARLDALCRELGGSLLVTSSRRTPAAFLRELRGKLTVPHFVHEYRPDALRNPYLGILAHANALVVTAESMSMVAEALATGVPTFLAPVRQPGRRWWRHLEQYRWRAISHRFVQAFAPQRFRRDVTRVHAALEAAGRVGTLEGLTAAAIDATPRAAPQLAELDHTARRVLALCDVSARQRDGESRRR